MSHESNAFLCYSLFVNLVLLCLTPHLIHRDPIPASNNGFFTAQVTSWLSDQIIHRTHTYTVRMSVYTLYNLDVWLCVYNIKSRYITWYNYNPRVKVQVDILWAVIEPCWITQSLQSTSFEARLTIIHHSDIWYMTHMTDGDCGPLTCELAIKARCVTQGASREASEAEVFGWLGTC